jgi:AmmeMemoRadiSam system protein B
VKALIGPHAGYKYSGPVAAWSYKYLASNPNKLRVFLLGPSHHKYLEGVSFSVCSQLETPLGNIEVDLESRFSLIQPCRP